MKTTRSSKSNPITGHALSLPVLADEASLSTLRSQTGLLSRVWRWIRARHVDAIQRQAIARGGDSFAG